MEVSEEDLQKIMSSKGVETQQAGQLATASANSIFAQNQDGNLIMWQLELDNILERIQHLLAGDEIVEDQEGNTIYRTPKDTSLIILNDYGVKLVMNTISFYLNRNTILSNYNPDRVNEILFDIGHELADLFFINYDVMGMDQIQKRSRYAILVMNILHQIESAYNRSLRGGERDSLRSARMVTQTDNTQPYAPNTNVPQKVGFWGNLLKP